jgi:tRNA1Val (adenine37-N6)-methyltransferase
MRKKNPYFHFKRFSINHANSSMKVGTDGVLLGCWVNPTGAMNILDIGTGSGLIAIMLGQRSDPEAVIDAVEIAEADVNQAVENVRNSPWRERITVHHTSIQDFRPNKKYQLIVSNPPFFVNSFAPPDLRRMSSRHTTALSFSDLILAVLELLDKEGRFAVIMPPVEGAILREYALTKGLYCNRLWEFRSRKSKPVERWLMEFMFSDQETQRGEVIMFKDPGDEWTDEFKEISKEFYLKL